MNCAKFDVVLVGHFSNDKNVVQEVEHSTPGGAIYYGVFPLKAIGVNVAVVTKAAPEDFSKFSVFKQKNIPVFTTEASHTTSIKNVYPSQNPDERESYVLERAEAFLEQDFSGIEAQVIHIGALMRGEVSFELIKVLSRRAHLSLDVQGFVRVEKEGKLLMQDWEKKELILPYITYLKTDLVEAKILAGASDIKSAAERLVKMGTSEVLITHKDGVGLLANGEFYEAPFSPRTLRGRTGRGDTCMATYLGKRLSLPPSQALSFAAKLTTIKLEQEGPFMGEPPVKLT